MPPPPNDAPLTFTVSEFTAAIEALSEADQGRLQKVARVYAMRTNGRMSADDLLHEAVKRTLQGTRKWSREVSVLQHLFGAMRSIASHAAIAKQEVEWSPLEDDPDAEEAKAAVKLLVEHLEQKNDIAAGLVLDALAAEEDPADIRKSLELDQVAFETIMKRIRRAGERLGVSAGRSTR